MDKKSNKSLRFQKNVFCESQHNRSELFAIKPDLSEINLASIHCGFTWNLNLCDVNKHHFLCLNVSISNKEHIIKGVKVLEHQRQKGNILNYQVEEFSSGYALV